MFVRLYSICSYFIYLLDSNGNVLSCRYRYTLMIEFVVYILYTCSIHIDYKL